MTSQEDLFAKFFNHEKILVKDMDMAKLREHRDELAAIAFEAKARLVANDDELKDRSSKSKNKEWLLPVEGDQISSDAINAVDKRKQRMSKMEKLESQLKSAGLDDDVVKQMIRDLERRATDKDIKVITFNKPSVETSAVTVKTAKPTEDVKPFDPSSIGFRKKDEN